MTDNPTDRRSQDEPRVLAESVQRLHAGIRPELHEALDRVLDGPRLTLGPELAAFEKEYARFCGAGHAVGVGSGTSALTLALRAMGVGPGDEVITVPNTYVATAFAISYVGATVVFVDVEADSYNMDPARVAEAVTDRTRAVLPVHLYGQCADVDAIAEQAPGIPILEDAAHAHGADLRGRRAGSLGTAAAFSFYPTKLLGAVGDGGIITTGDVALDERLRQLRYMGQRGVKHQHEDLGYQDRLDELQAAFLRIKLDRMEDQIEGRRRVARFYDEALADVPLTLPKRDLTGRHVYYMYTVLAPDRDRLADHLRSRGIDTQIIYPRLVPDQGAYRNQPMRIQGDLPVARELPDTLLCLPMWPELTERETERVVEAVREFYAAG